MPSLRKTLRSVPITMEREGEREGKKEEEKSLQTQAWNSGHAPRTPFVYCVLLIHRLLVYISSNMSQEILKKIKMIYKYSILEEPNLIYFMNKGHELICLFTKLSTL